MWDTPECFSKSFPVHRFPTYLHRIVFECIWLSKQSHHLTAGHGFGQGHHCLRWAHCCQGGTTLQHWKHMKWPSWWNSSRPQAWTSGPWHVVRSWGPVTTTWTASWVKEKHIYFLFFSIFLQTFIFDYFCVFGNLVLKTPAISELGNFPVCNFQAAASWYFWIFQALWSLRHWWGPNLPFTSCRVKAVIEDERAVQEMCCNRQIRGFSAGQKAHAISAAFITFPCVAEGFVAVQSSPDLEAEDLRSRGSRVYMSLLVLYLEIVAAFTPINHEMRFCIGVILCPCAARWKRV